MAMNDLNLPIPKQDMCAVILAGGDSQRMGQDKSLLAINGIPLIQHIFTHLSDWFAEIVISTNEPDRYQFINCQVIPDEITGQGPLMAIYSVLKSLGKPLSVMATDIPDIPVNILESILKLTHENPASQVILPITSRGEYEPLFAVYRPEILPAMESALERGQRHIYGLFTEGPITTYTLQPDESIPNLNRPADVTRFMDSRR